VRAVTVVPVGTMNLWSPSRRRLNDPGRLARRGSLVTSSPMAPPCSSSFGPSRLDWSSRIGTMTSADSCARRGLLRRRSSLSGKPYSLERRRLASRLQVSPDKSVIFRCTSSPFTWTVVWERLRDVVVTRLTEPALYDVSVRSLAALTWNASGWGQQTRRLPIHPQASSPRSVALPQLPSSSTLSIGVDIWYTALLETPSLVQGTCTP
jgi:hypothetical protein